MPRETDRIRIALAALLLVCAIQAGAKIPDWMRQASGQSLPIYPPDTDAVILLEDTDLNIEGPGVYVEHYRGVVKILRREGAEYGDLAVFVQRDEKVLSIHGWSVDAAGHEFEIKDKDFQESSSWDYELYTDSKYRHAKAPAAEPGTVVGFEYEVRRHDWLNQIPWLIQERVPVRRAGFAIHLPPGWEYKATWSAMPPVEPVTAGGNGWKWTVNDVPRLEDEPRRPSYAALRGRMWLAYFGPGQPNSASWKAIGVWYKGLTAERRGATPPIVEKVKQLTANAANFEARARALTSFLQAEIRYVAIQIGIGGFQPHPAQDVFRYRYGDCKDKVTLLSTMLQEAGITSHYVLISTHRGSVDPAVPSPWFNHAIIAIQLPEGEIPAGFQAVVKTDSGKRYLLFDPTDEYTPLGKIGGELQNSYGLLVTEAGGELIPTPLLAPESNVLSREGHFTLQPDGTITGELVEERTGDHASGERAFLSHANDQQRVQRVERRLNRSLKGFSLSDLQIQQPSGLSETLRLSLKLTAPQYAQVRGPQLLVRPRVIGEKSFALERKPRHYPLELGTPVREVDQFELNLPSGYRVDDLPQGQDLDFGFATYRSRYESKGEKIEYWREYKQKEVRVPAEKIEEVRKLEGLIGADEQAVVILKRAE